MALKQAEVRFMCFVQAVEILLRRSQPGYGDGIRGHEGDLSLW